MDLSPGGTTDSSPPVPLAGYKFRVKRRAGGTVENISEELFQSSLRDGVLRTLVPGGETAGLLSHVPPGHDCEPRNNSRKG
jgi:hypothetical protein